MYYHIMYSLSEAETTHTTSSIMESEIQSWDELDLNHALLRGIYNHGFEMPSAIQKKAIRPILLGKDVIGQAQSGTGKTGAFSVSALQKINIELRETQAIILVPTHELANQIYRVVLSLSTFMEGLVVKTLLGGTPIHEDLDSLKNHTPHIIIGCTGRVYDMMRRRAMSLDYIQLCILDEADEMLSQGFKEQIYNIFQVLPSSVQIALFSATMPEPMMNLTDKFMRDPVRIVMKTEELNLDGIRQYYIAIQDDHAKYDTLKSIFEQLTISQTIIYANSVPRVMDLYNAMLEEGFSVCCIHSNMNKIDRNAVITGFRAGAYRVMISSNLTARGIDVQQVNTVINFDIPRSTETYLHRIGRSGRWGRKGTAINFVTKHDIQYMKAIEKHYGIDVAELPKDFSW